MQQQKKNNNANRPAYKRNDTRRKNNKKEWVSQRDNISVHEYKNGTLKQSHPYSRHQQNL